MRILYIIPYFLPAWHFGGEVKTTFEIAKNISNIEEISITVITTNLYSKNYKIQNGKINYKNIEIIYFENLLYKFSLKSLIIFPIKMRKWLKKNLKNFDLVHIQNIYFISSFWALFFARKNKIPVVLTTSGVLSKYSQKRFYFLKKILKIYIISLFKNAKFIFAQSISEKEEIRKIYGFGEKLILINNGIDIKNYETLPDRAIFRNKYKIDLKHNIILFLGRLNQVKGIEFLIKSFSNIDVNNFNNTKLIIVGPSTERYLKKIKHLISKLNLCSNILIIDGLYGKEKMEVYASADIFCLPSLYDCAPNSMIEAGASGLPVITTSANGISNLIKKHGGLIVKPCNVKSLSQALSLYLNDPNRRKNDGNYLKQKILKNYSWISITKKLAKIYKKVIDHRKISNYPNL